MRFFGLKTTKPYEGGVGSAFCIYASRGFQREFHLKESGHAGWTVLAFWSLTCRLVYRRAAGVQTLSGVGKML